MNDRKYVRLSIAIIIIVTILRFAFAITHTVSGDACWQLSAARFIANENKIPLFEGIGRLQPFWAPPVFHLVATFLYKISMPVSLDLANLSLKLVSPIFGTLTVIILYFISRKVFDGKTTFYSMIFINLLPLFMDYSILGYVGSTVGFFSILSVFFMINNRYILSSIALGFAMLSKYNAVFILPMLVYLAYMGSSNKREIYIKLPFIILLPLFISSIWFIRNFILLRNPFWPFLNDIFHGIDLGTSFHTTNFGPLFSFGTYLKSYLEIFGVPNGNLGLLAFLNFPLLKYLIFVWFIGTLIFIFPIFRSFFYNKVVTIKKKYFVKSIYILFISFLLMFILYVLSLGAFASRLLMPIVPFMAIIWALGLRSIKNEKIYAILLLVIGAGFIIVESTKLTIASNEWDLYESDFNWVRTNTDKEDIFYGNGQCLHYNINRLVIDHLADLNFDEVDYIWVNKKWRIDFPMRSKPLRKIEENNKLITIYNNSDTGTMIYKVR